MAASGWNLIQAGTSGNVRGSVYYKIAGSSEGAVPVSFTVPLQASGAIATYTGVDSVSPIEDSRKKTSTASTSVTVESINASARGELVGFVAVNDTSTQGLGVGSGQSLTQRWSRSTGAPPALGATSVGSDKSLTSGGPTGSQSASSSSASNWVAALVSLRPGTGTTTYSYNADDELTSTTDPLVTTSYGYDAAGNEVAAGARTLSYDLAGRTSQIADPTSTTTYSYDGEGKRTSAVQGSTTTNFAWDPNGGLSHLAEEKDGAGSLLRRYDYGDAVLSETTPSATSFYQTDALGSVTSTNGAGDQAWSYTYEPFGSSRAATQIDASTPTQPMRFTGQYLDPTGLYHLRARQYDAATGRFAEQDPLAPANENPSVSSYTYANNRPLVLVDPTGLRGGMPGGAFGSCFGDTVEDAVQLATTPGIVTLWRLNQEAQDAGGNTWDYFNVFFNPAYWAVKGYAAEYDAVLANDSSGATYHACRTIVNAEAATALIGKGVLEGTATLAGQTALPELSGTIAESFEGASYTNVTFKAGTTFYRAEAAEASAPGRFLGLEDATTKATAEKLYNVGPSPSNNPMDVMRTYELQEDVTMYFGKVAGGEGYQALLPRSVDPPNVLRLVNEKPLR